MPIKPTPSTLPHWRLQKTQRSKGMYFQAVWGSGDSRRCVTLGYLTQPEADAALAALSTAKAPALTNVDEDGEPMVSDQGIKLWATEVSLEAVVNEMAASQARTSGDFGKLPLKNFVEEVFWAVRSKEVKASSLKNEVSQWRKIHKVLGSTPLKRIDGMAVERLMAHYASDSGPARRRLGIVLKSALKYAVDVGILKELPRMRPVKGGQARVGPRPQALSQEEVALILGQAPSPMHRALWGFAVGQGVRPSEACYLDWSDVDFVVGKVTVRGTKTERSFRVVPMTPATRGVLEPYWRAQGCPTTGYAFTWKGAPPRDWRLGFQAAAKRAGITKPVKAYSARHTFATACALANVPQAATKEMLGHTASSRTLEEVYSNPDPGMLAAAVAGLTKLGG